MTIPPYEKLLHKELHIHDAQEHFAPQLDMLEGIANYGSSLIAGTFHTSNKELKDIIVLIVLLKQVVAMIDSVQVLAKNACTDTILLPGRALLEASLYIDWILKDDSEKKSLYYYVSNVREELIWCKRTIEGNSEHERFFESLGDFSESLEKTKERLGNFASNRVLEIDKFLAKNPYREVSEHFESERGNRPYEVSWHTPLGKRSVRQIADDVNRLHEYEMFYSLTSKKMHSSSYKSHVTIKNGIISIEPIRHLEGLKTTLNFIVAATFHTYRKVLKYYRPGQTAEFNSKYTEYWREPFLNMQNINYSTDVDEPIL